MSGMGGVDERPCIGCGGMVPNIEGPTHRYMESSPGCWQLYGEVLSLEYSDRAFATWHRLTVDAYAVQHPGHESRQTKQSVCVHLMSLCLVLEHGADTVHATRAIGEAVKQKDRYIWLVPPASLGDITVANVAPIATAQEHVRAVREWAKSAWAAWAPYHDLVRGWVPRGK